jgi:hypothetical protein
VAVATEDGVAVGVFVDTAETLGVAVERGIAVAVGVAVAAAPTVKLPTCRSMRTS